MRKPPPVSRRFSRSRRNVAIIENRVESSATAVSPQDKWWQHFHNWLSLVVAAFAAAAAIGSLWVGSKQATLMDLARNDAIVAAKSAEEAAVKSANIAVQEASASLKQADALSAQVGIITEQLRISRYQAESSRTQARSMERLARATGIQAQSSLRLAQLNDQQYNLQNFAYFESQKSIITAEFSNSEMNVSQQWEYDLTKPIRFYATYRNIGVNSAAVFSRIQPQIVEGNFRIDTIYCPSFDCDNRSPKTVSSGQAMVEWQDFLPSRTDYYSDGKDWRMVVIAAFDYRDIVQRKNYKKPICMAYSFRTKLWGLCGELGLIQ
jgi:hypothetical protein